MEQSDIEPVLETLKPWLSNPNIVRVHVGKKMVGGVATPDWAVVVGVIEKKPRAALKPADFEIPPEIEMRVPRTDGGFESVPVPTDVVQTGQVRADRLTKERPCPGGYRIQAAGMGGGGTLGVNIVWRGKYRLLTCNHVIADNDKNKIGDWVYQPEIGTFTDLARVSGFAPLTVQTDSTDPTKWNMLDLAWCDIADKDKGKFSEEIYGLGKPTGYRGPRVGETVCVVGAKTGQGKYASIESRTAQLKIPMMGGVVYFHRMIMLDTCVTQKGDSGAAFVSMEDNMVVAINVGSDDEKKNSYGCWIAFEKPPPLVTEVIPASGLAAGGNPVTVKGRGFTGAIAVNFGTVAAPNLAVASDTKLTVTSPPANVGDRNPVDVTVTTQDGASATRDADRFTYT